MVSSASPNINKALQQEIEEKAKRVVSFGDQTPGAYYGFAMNMKAQLDALLKNN